jgi:hypothetical protein
VHQGCHSGPEEVPYLPEEACSNPAAPGVPPIDWVAQCSHFATSSAPDLFHPIVGLWWVYVGGI